MTTTVTLANMPSTPADVSVRFLDQSKLVARAANPVLLATGGLVSEYVYNDGDPTTETSVTVRVNADPKTGIVRNSIRLSTIQTVDDGTDVTEIAPIEVVLAWNTPGVMEDPQAVLDMIGTAYSLAFDGVTTKEPNATIISAINRGLINDLYS